MDELLFAKSRLGERHCENRTHFDNFCQKIPRGTLAKVASVMYIKLYA